MHGEGATCSPDKKKWWPTLKKLVDMLLFYMLAVRTSRITIFVLHNNSTSSWYGGGGGGYHMQCNFLKYKMSSGATG